MKSVDPIPENIKFENNKQKKAHKLWNKAIEDLGGAIRVSKLSGLSQPRISLISCGVVVNGQRVRRSPTPEQAIKISILTEGLFKAEDLLPEHDFSYMYEYMNLVIDKKEM